MDKRQCDISAFKKDAEFYGQNKRESWFIWDLKSILVKNILKSSINLNIYSKLVIKSLKKAVKKL